MLKIIKIADQTLENSIRILYEYNTKQIEKHEIFKTMLNFFYVPIIN